MKCPTCATEHNGTFCTNCGTPANLPNSQPVYTIGKQKKPKKPVFTRWWFWVILVIVGIGVIANLGSGEKDPSKDIASSVSPYTSQAVNNTTISTPSTTTSGSQPTKPTASQPSEAKVDLSSIATTYTLTNGNYASGIDIPVGKCNVTAVKGSGNLSSSNLYNGGVNEMFGVDDGSELYTSTFNGLKLPKDTVLTLSGGLTIKLEFTSIDANFSGRTYNDANAITLKSGNYEAGSDFTAGIYKIIAISGSGNLSSSNLFDGGVNEMFGIDDGSGLYSSEFTNVVLSKGVELTISGGLKVKLIPAT